MESYFSSRSADFYKCIKGLFQRCEKGVAMGGKFFEDEK